MSTVNSYQSGSLIRRTRKRLPDVWEFRYRRYDASGAWKYQRETLGTIEEFPTRKSVMPLVDEWRRRINDEKPGTFFRDLSKRYEDDEIPKLRPHVQAGYRAMLRYLKDSFDARRLDSITAGELDTWINSLESRKWPGKPLSRHSRQHVKALAHMVWRKAMLWGYLKLDTNPVSIARVTHGARPKIRSAIVTPAAYRKLLADPELVPVVKAMVQVAMICGMRVSEILGLKWEDVDFSNMVIHVRRSAVGKATDQTKNEASEADVPMHDSLADALLAWKKAEPIYEGWIFGSPLTNRPYHAGIMQQNHLEPAGVRAGITKLGWHAFRHTHSADLELAEASDRVQQASMRHGDAAMTKHYGKHSPALMEKMRKAQAKVIELLSAPEQATGTEGK